MQRSDCEKENETDAEKEGAEKTDKARREKLVLYDAWREAEEKNIYEQSRRKRSNHVS